MTRPALLSLVLVALTVTVAPAARAEDEPQPAADTADSTAAAEPPSASEERSDPTVLRTFRAQSLVYDPVTGGAYEGTERRRLDAHQLYSRMGRQDLVDRVDARDRSRSILFFTGGAAAVLGVAGLIVAYATGPHLNSASCVSSMAAYNSCVDASHVHQGGGALALTAGGVIGMTLVFWGLGMNASPVSSRDAQALVQLHNGATLRSLRAAAPAPAVPQSRLRIAPQIGLSGGGLSAMFTF